MGMDGNHGNSTSSHFDTNTTARIAQHRQGGDGNPTKQHTAYNGTPGRFELAAGMGMDGNHGNSTHAHQHLA